MCDGWRERERETGREGGREREVERNRMNVSSNSPLHGVPSYGKYVKGNTDLSLKYVLCPV